MGRSNKISKKETARLISQYGSDVLESEWFEASKNQKHHFRTSVASHTTQVAAGTLRVCRMMKAHGIEVDEEMAVKAALCHDLGMVGRDEKYRNNYETLKRHPVDSVEIAKTIYPQMNGRMEEVILRHMWPLSLHCPRSAEGFAVSIADKLVSITDVFSRKPRRQKNP